MIYGIVEQLIFAIGGVEVRFEHLVVRAGTGVEYLKNPAQRIVTKGALPVLGRRDLLGNGLNPAIAIIAGGGL